MIKSLYKIKNEIASFSDDEKEIYLSMLKYKYDFSDSILQKELGIESLKKIFFQFIKKKKNFNKMDSLTLKKIAKLSRREQLPKVLSNNYNSIKHLINNDDFSIELIMLRILYLLDNEIVKIETIEMNIDHIKNINKMKIQNQEIDDILKLYRKKTYKRAGKKYKQKKNKPFSVEKRNKIFKKIMEKKNKIFVEEKINDEDEYDKNLQYYLEKINRNVKDSVTFTTKINFSYKVLDQYKEYFDFLFRLKEKSNGQIDNIIRDTFYCLFDENQVHIDLMLEKNERFYIPFKYEENNNIYEISSTIIDYLEHMKDHNNINEIVEYLLSYLHEKEYVDKFLQCDTIFFFATLKSLLRNINYKGNSPIIKEMEKLFINSRMEKNDKIKKGKIKFFNKYKDIIDLENINYDDIPKNDAGLILMKLEIVKDKKRLKDYILKLFPKTGEASYKILRSKGIKTFFQYKNSKYYREETKEIKKEKDIKMVKNIIDIYNIDIIPFNNKKTKNYTNTIDKMEKKIEIINFKSLFGLTMINSNDLQIKYEKMVFNLNENNRNMTLVSKLESNMLLLKNRIEKTIDDNKKSKMIMDLKTMERKRDSYQSQVRDLNIYGYSYGTNYQQDYIGNQKFITSDIINKGKKMKEVMDTIDLVLKRKSENFKLNTFVIDMLLNFEYINTELYNTYDLYINHNIEIIFEKYCEKTYKNIRRDLKDIGNSNLTKPFSLNFSRLSMILFFIISNQDHINNIYKQFTIKNKMYYLNRYVKYNNKIGKVLEVDGENLYIQFDLDIEMLNKDQVTLVKTMIDKDIMIIKGNYKGRMGRVYKQIGETLTLTLDTYGKSNDVISTKVRSVTLPLSYVKLIERYERKIIGDDELLFLEKSDEIQYIKEVNPRNIKNRDLFSIARFLYSQVVNKDRNMDVIGYNPKNFIKIYKVALKHVNEMIKKSEINNKDLQSKKEQKDKSYFKLKQIYSREGLMDFKLNKSKFRMTNEDIRLFRDNSDDYINEMEIEMKQGKYKKSKKEENESKKEEQIKLKNDISKIINKFENILDLI